VLVAAIPMELKRRWHFDSLSTASASSAGDITRNSFTPYLKRHNNFRLTSQSFFKQLKKRLILLGGGALVVGARWCGV